MPRNIAPAYLNEKVTMFKPTTRISLRPGHSRDNLMFECSVEKRQNPTVITRMILEWNDLPVKLRSNENLLVFKKELKTYYFKRAFSQYC